MINPEILETSVQTRTEHEIPIPPLVRFLDGPSSGQTIEIFWKRSKETKEEKMIKVVRIVRRSLPPVTSEEKRIESYEASEEEVEAARDWNYRFRARQLNLQTRIDSSEPNYVNPTWVEIQLNQIQSQLKSPTPQISLW